MQFDSTQVRCFLAAVGTRSWTQAAQQLSLSPPLVREQVSALERNLDVPLWEVEEPVLTPTREGEALAALFREMSDRLEGLLASLRARAQGGPARLTVGVYDGADQAGLLQSIGRDLGRAGPQSVPAFSGGSALQLCQGFRSGRYDALLFPREIAESLSRIGLLSRTRTAEVGTLRTCLYCAGHNPAAALEHPTPAQFQGQILYCLDHSLFPPDVAAHRALLTRYGLSPVRQYVAGVEALAAALLTGDGFAVLDEASPLADYEGIHAFPTEESVSICLVTPERPAAPVERFLHYLGGQGG